MSISSTLAKTVSAVASFGLNMTRALFGLSTASNSSTRIRSTAAQPVDSESLASATQVLGLIYRLMIRARDQKEKLRIEGERIETNLEKKYNDRNDEIVKAIRGIKPKAPKVEVEPQPTEAVTPTVPIPPVTPKVPTPPVTSLPKAPPKAPSTKIITGTAAAGLGLLPLLAKGESKDPNQLVYPKKEFRGIAPSKANLTDMTIKEVFEKQTQMSASGQYPSTAVGKYQIIKSTLEEAVNSMKLDLNQKFDEPLQDRIYKEHLISKKRPAVEAFISGRSDNLELAQLEMAKEFASFPVPVDMVVKNKEGKVIRTLKKGQSYYAGDKAKNKAHITVEESARGLLEERAARTGKPTQQSSDVENNLNVGSKMESASVENQDLVKSLKEKQTQMVNTTNVINQSEDASGDIKSTEVGDDRPAILRKR